LGALSGLGLGCHTVDVRSGSEPQTDFSRFHTFNVAEAPSSDHPQLTGTNRMRIQSAVTAEMIRRGFQLEEQPELLFSIHLASAEKTYNKSNPSVEGDSLGANLSKHYGLVYNKELGAEPVVDYTEGTLSLKAFDTKENRLVWEGSAVGMLHQNRPDEQVKKRIQEAVHAIFAQFPVKPDGK
jgi:hypothetical protein